MWLSQDQVATHGNWERAVLRQTMPRSDPQQLGLVRIELETLSGHPLTNICDAAFETISCWRSVVMTAVQIHLCVVSVLVPLHCASGLQLRGPPCIQWTAADRAPSLVKQNTRCRPRTTYSRCTQHGTFCRRGTIETTLARCHTVQTGVQAGVTAGRGRQCRRLLWGRAGKEPISDRCLQQPADR